MSVVYSSATDNTTRRSTNGTEDWSYTGQSQTVWKVVTDPDENVYSASSDGSVQKIDANGEHVWTYSGAVDGVYSVAVDADRRVFICEGGGEEGDQYVKSLDANGGFLWQYAVEANPVDLVVAPSGFIYLSGQSYSNVGFLRKINSSGDFVWEALPNSTTDELDLDADENIYVALINNRVRKYPPSGVDPDVFFIGSPVRGIAVHPDGFFFIGDEGSNLRKRQASNGDNVWTYTEFTGTVRSVCVDPVGNSFGASHDNTVRKIDPSGNFVWSFTGHTGLVLGVATLPGRPYTFPTEWDAFVSTPENLTVTVDGDHLRASWTSDFGEFILQRERWDKVTPPPT